MDRRRALTQRPASNEGIIPFLSNQSLSHEPLICLRLLNDLAMLSESGNSSNNKELQCWAHAASKLAAYRDTYNNQGTLEAMARVNRSISAWPAMSGENGEPLESLETVKATYKKLSSGLTEIKDAAELEAKTIEETLEALSVLIAIRKAPENVMNQGATEKRNKRNRGSSPSSAPATPVPTPINKITLNVKSDRDRTSESPVAQPAQPFKSDAKARSKFYGKQLPLQENRKVAFHQPSTTGEASTWILAVVTRCLNQEKNRYEVQDVEPQEDGQPGLRYTSNLKTMIPLPDPEAAPTDPSHPNAYPIFNAGSTVMALYPDTSCFYRAVVTEVIPAPREGKIHFAKQAYRLRFEDDDDQIHAVPAQWVVEWPGS
ncbi:hypothetical protein EW145_g833 [Phellinidium pouzarii]|uniref:SGF29 C-terminal domain-containing protein n=1 Tax=Phellinidium pouzarii TaxID=167371 RepID=A0A4S4LGT6_9AGAM|nr:hypothetical protein EW145_g833 [Phellinidium pouzarii]